MANKNDLLIVEMSSSQLKVAEGENKEYILEGIFGEIDSKNKNNRIYTEDEYVPQIQQLQDKIKSSKLLGELDHPQQFDVSLKNVSHIIEELYYDKDNKHVKGKIRLLDTDAGRQAKALVDAGVPLQISSRAAGAVESNGKVKIKQLFTYDLVADPGFANAELKRVNESYGFDDNSGLWIYEMNGEGAEAPEVAQEITETNIETNNNKNLFEGVAKKFDLKNVINLVEVYDNSHISGTNSVGAMVTYGNEGFVKKRYRKFDIKTKGAEQDDFAMLKEVLSRRFKRAILEKGNYLTLPDLILIDGGKGQYSSAKEVLDELGLHDLPMIAIAKGKFRNSGDETFFYNGKSYKFEKNDPTLFFMQRLRDEAHRFAITSHRAKRAKGLSKSLLDQIDGIGAVRKRALLNHFGSARSVESASFDEIKSVEGVEEKVAKKIYNFFHE